MINQFDNFKRLLLFPNRLVRVFRESCFLARTSGTSGTGALKPSSVLYPDVSQGCPKPSFSLGRLVQENKPFWLKVSG
jgi:hypothetical protein